MRVLMSVCAVASVLLGGCGTIPYGDAATEPRLKQLAPVPGKLSFFACREEGFLAGSMTPEVVVGGQSIGPLRPGSFVHAALPPGSHEVVLDRGVGIPGLFGKTGVLPVAGKAGDTVIIWVGAVGGGFGGVNLGNFDNKADAEKCVKAGRYIALKP